jgi:hypothetical protein
MKKNYFLTLTLAFLIFVYHAEAQTLTFASDAGNLWNDGIAMDGEGGSTNISGLSIQIYNVDASLNNINKMEWYSNVDLATNNGFNGITTFYFSGDASFKGQIIKETAGLEFQINGFGWYDWGNNNSQPMTVTGFKDGTQVAITTFVGNNNPSSIYVSLNSDFDNVDEVRILTTSGTTYPSINNIEIAGAVLNTEAHAVADLKIIAKNKKFISNSKDVVIEVYSILGQKMKNENLLSGIYLVKVTLKNAKSIVLKRYL